MTLTSLAFGRPGLAVQAGLVLAGSLLIAVAAQIQMPLYPVPMTLQTAAVLFVGFALGARLGTAAVVAYLVEGALGAPVFAGLKPGAVAFVGPTAGFLLGFVAMAFVAGWAADRGWGLVKLSLVGIAASALIYVPGLAWPAFAAGAAGIEAGWVGMSGWPLLSAFATPFLVGDAIKAVLAALVATGGAAALRNLRG